MLDKRVYKKLDWGIIFCYLIIVIFGLLNIHASVYSGSSSFTLSPENLSVMQLIWIGVSLMVALLIIFVISPQLYLSFSWWLYFITAILLVLVLIIGKEVNGAKAWIALGPIRFQPSEFSKITTSLALSTIIGKYNFKMSNKNDMTKVILTLLLPVTLIMLEPDPGTVLVYCGFAFMLFREGITGWLLVFVGWIAILFVLTLKFNPTFSFLFLLGGYGLLKGIFSKRVLGHILIYGVLITIFSILAKYLKIESYYSVLFIIPVVAVSLWRNKRSNRPIRLKFLVLSLICSVLFIFSVQLIFDKVLKAHHRDRIENLLGITEDLKGAGYNVHQSKIAIGSGGLNGKGYLQGTQTKFKFVPEQSTDFIFCTVGEEWGFVGSAGLVLVFFILIYRIIRAAEKHTDRTIRVYGYCVACALFMHVFINISMTLGLFPVVGIPLPFVSYGGTSFLSFTILLFIFLRLDLERWT